MTKKHLVIDTNIISHAMTANQTAAYAKLLEKYQTEYTFCVTGFTQYELLCSSSKEKQEEIMEFVSQNLTLFELSQPLMDFTARVYNLYSTHKSTKGLKITNGDIVNASLAIIKNVPIMTIDNNDYPTPFFREIARERVRYESRKDREVMNTVYILEPDMENIKYCFESAKL